MAHSKARLLGDRRRQVGRAIAAFVAVASQAGLGALLLTPDAASVSGMIIAVVVMLAVSVLAVATQIALSCTPRIHVAGRTVRTGGGTIAAAYDLGNASAFALETMDRKGVRLRSYANWTPLGPGPIPERRVVRLRVRDRYSGSWILVPLHDAEGNDLPADRLQGLIMAIEPLAGPGTGSTVTAMRHIIDRRGWSA